MLLVLGIFGAFVALPYLGSKAGGRIARGTLLGGKAALPGQPSAPHVPGLASLSIAPAASPLVTAKPGNPVFQHPTLTISGYIVHDGRVNVLLSDGTVLTERDRELQTVRRNEVVIDGVKYALHEPARPPRKEPAAKPARPAAPVAAAPVTPKLPTDDGITRISPPPRWISRRISLGRCASLRPLLTHAVSAG